jgi:hypothetical protein
MTIKLTRAFAFALATSTLAFAWKEPVSLFPSVISEGQPKGEIKNVSGSKSISGPIDRYEQL